MSKRRQPRWQWLVSVSHNLNRRKERQVRIAYNAQRRALHLATTHFPTDIRPNAYFARDGAPLSLQGWTRRFEFAPYRQVALHRFRDGWRLSTIWLGIPQGISFLFREVPPQVFETMLFHNHEAVYKTTHAREHDARKEHFAIVRCLRAAKTKEQLVQLANMLDVEGSAIKC